MASKTISLRRVRHIIEGRAGTCEEAVRHYEQRQAETGDATYERMAATERCAALELRHVLRLLEDGE